MVFRPRYSPASRRFVNRFSSRWTTAADSGRSSTCNTPNPAGLERVSVDRWSRTVYDRVPQPPPHGPHGADRVTILEDTDGDGRADNFTDFVDGLNLATGLAFGHGGVYVLQVPYLLFYPDRDRDDVPDADPTVLLTGFGMEDAQSLANHLTWGPDGWLYGVNGSTTTCNIRGIEFQQGVWRYHPLRDEFELFCEGGGNTFGLTFDERGNLFYSTNGGPFVHALQGAYYRKSFGKHGPLHNLYAYGFFEVVERDQVPGGPPTGGTIYLGDAFPERFRGTFIAGNFLGHTASWWDVSSHASTFRATYGGVLLNSHDAWFGPTDMCVGPAGEMYLSDFHDQRTAHPDPDANWDLSNGRIYRITARNPPAESFDLVTRSSSDLVDLLQHPNRWFADRARMELAGRRDSSVVPALTEMAIQEDDELQSLQGAWALHASGGLDDEIAATLLEHPSESVRMWTTRLIGDRKTVSPAMLGQILRLAASEESAVVRCQLAATARRLPAADGVPMLMALVDAVPQDGDQRTPWMIWWGIESHALAGRESLLDTFNRETAWSTGPWRMQTRLLIRRWAAAGTTQSYSDAQRLLATASSEQRDSAFSMLSLGLSERAAELGDVEQGGLFEQFAVSGSAGDEVETVSVDPVSGALRAEVNDYWQEAPDEPDRIRLALLCGIDDADRHLLEKIDDGAAVSHLQLLLEFGNDQCVPFVLPLLQTASDEEQLSAVIRVLGRFGNSDTTDALLAAYPNLVDELQSQVADVLLTRPDSALRLLEEVQAETIAREEISPGQLRTGAIHEDDQLNALIRELWGNIAPGTPEEMLATMRRFNNDLRAGSGDAGRGKVLYTHHCATCHVLFNEGGKVGPELTTANRGDLAALLANIVDPSAVVRREYINYTVATEDGRVLNGLIAEQDAAGITILDAKNQRTRLRRDEIDEISEADVSLMPERLLEKLAPQELRDLFSYLQQQPAQ